MSLHDEIAEAIRAEAWRPGVTPEDTASSVLAVLHHRMIELDWCARCSAWTAEGDLMHREHGSTPCPDMLIGMGER